MAFMTPRGLLISLEVSEGFSLLTRLWEKDPKTDAFRVLKTCEAIYAIPAVVGFIAGLIAVFFPGCPRWAIAASIAVGWCVGQLLTVFGVFVIIRPTGLLMAGLIWSYIPFRTLGQLALLVFLLVKFGWAVPVLWLVGAAVGMGCAGAIEKMVTSWGIRKAGVVMTFSGVCFVHAYRIHADRLRVTLDITLSTEEKEGLSWQDCLLDYARKYPKSVARFCSLDTLRASIISDPQYDQIRRRGIAHGTRVREEFP
jgi:hypothetical protein